MTWVTDHRWESLSITLGTVLVVVLGLLLSEVGSGAAETGTESQTGPGTTVSSGVSNGPGATDVGAEEPEGEGSQPVTGPGPFGGDTPISVTAVVVDNVGDVGPQIGIDQAQLIIEVPVEGGVTRYTALYGAETPDLIGPVRSLRPVSADLLALFDPVVFTTGGQPFVRGMVEATGATIVTPELSPAFQSLERPQPHDVFVTPSVDDSSSQPVTAPWEYGEWVGGEPATEVTIPFGGGITWRFEDGVYVRYIGEERVEVLPAFGADPVPLTRDTLIIMLVNQKSAGYTDSAGADVPDFDVVGSGKMFVFHQGEVVDGRWLRSSQAGGYQFVIQNGDRLPVPTGRLYMGVAPDGLIVEVGQS